MLSELWSHQTTVRGTHKSTMFPGKSPHLQDLAVISDDCMDCPDGSRRITESGMMTWNGGTWQKRAGCHPKIQWPAFFGISPQQLWLDERSRGFLCSQHGWFWDCRVCESIGTLLINPVYVSSVNITKRWVEDGTSWLKIGIQWSVEHWTIVRWSG